MRQSRDGQTGNNVYDFRMGTTTSGHATFLDWKNDGAGNYEVASIGYDARGDVTSYTLSNGVTTLARDERMQMWSRTGTSFEHRYRYSPSGQLIDRREVTGNASRDEYIYLAGMPIGVTHTDGTYPSPRSWWLSPDAGGTPRRVFERTSTMRQKIRLIMGAFGDGVEVDDSDIISGVGVVGLPFRHAGQVAETGTPFMVENRWRMYNPDLGVYLSPDPLHRAGARSYSGPQAYAYASGRPLYFSDPTGQIVYDRNSEQLCNCECGLAWDKVEQELAARASRPACRAWFTSRTPYDIANLVVPGAAPPLSWHKTRGPEYSPWERKIYMPCLSSGFICKNKCDDKVNAEAIARTVIHELFHFADPNANAPIYEAMTGEANASAAEVECGFPPNPAYGAY